MFRTLVSLAAAAAASGAQSAIVTLDFEGVGDGAAIKHFYNGGTDSDGNSGVNYGVWINGALTSGTGLIDQDAGGSGNFGNEPSPSTVMSVAGGAIVDLIFAGDFDTSLSFSYAAAGTEPSHVYFGDYINNVSHFVDLAGIGSGNCGDPTGDLCIWTPITVSFSGTAKWITFVPNAQGLLVDDISFSTDAPVVSAPEPSSYAMMAIGLLGLAAWSRRQPRP